MGYSLKKILLIDDDESFLELVKKYLEHEDFEVICADCGEDGMSLVEEKDLDLVLLDIMMPKISGWDVYQHIKSVKPDIPVSFLTSMEKLPSLDKYDIEDYILKERPFTKDKLIEKIESLLEE